MLMQRTGAPHNRFIFTLGALFWFQRCGKARNFGEVGKSEAARTED
jgi:hypothetical protein